MPVVEVVRNAPKSHEQQLLDRLVSSKETVQACMVSPRGPWAYIQGRVMQEGNSGDQYSINADSLGYIVFDLNECLVKYDVSKGHIVLRIE